MNMVLKCLSSPLSSAISISNPVASSQPSLLPPPHDATHQRSLLSNAQKLNKIFDYLWNNLYWGISNFIEALAITEDPVNTHRKTAFTIAAYKNLKVLKLYFSDKYQPWNSVRQSVIQALDLRENELQKEVESLGTITLFCKFNLTSGEVEGFEALDINQVLDTIQKQVLLLIQLLRNIMAPENWQTYQRQKELIARFMAIISIFGFS